MTEGTGTVSVELLNSERRVADSLRAEGARLQRELADTRAERDEARRLHGKHILDASRQLTEANAALGRDDRDGALVNEERLKAENADLKERLAEALRQLGMVSADLGRVTHEQSEKTEGK